MQTQKIVSWNVASVRARLPALRQLLIQENPDVVLLQEIKAEEATFPYMDLKGMGYNAIICGQKSYNGVAILARKNITPLLTVLPGGPLQEVPQARFIEGRLPTGEIVICVYVPNGNPPEKNPKDTSRLTYKIEWMRALIQHLQKLLAQNETVILGGDFNVIELDSDVYNPDAYRTNALMVPPVRDEYARLNALAMTNAIRLKNPLPHTYSFWDFQMGAWAKNWGMLLDALFVSNNIKDNIVNAGIYKEVRGWEKTSDHAPVFVELKK